MKNTILGLFALASIAALSGCTVEGCTDENAFNYEPKATKDDNSCKFVDPIYSGTWHVTENYATSPDVSYDVNVDYASGSVSISNWGNQGQSFFLQLNVANGQFSVNTPGIERPDRTFFIESSSYDYYEMSIYCETYTPPYTVNSVAEYCTLTFNAQH